MIDSYKTPLIVVGRVLLALMFILAGFGKLTDIAGTAGYIASGGLPMASALAVLVGLLELARRTRHRDRLPGALGSPGTRPVHARRERAVPQVLGRTRGPGLRAATDVHEEPVGRRRSVHRRGAERRAGQRRRAPGTGPRHRLTRRQLAGQSSRKPCSTVALSSARVPRAIPPGRQAGRTRPSIRSACRRSRCRRACRARRS